MGIRFPATAIAIGALLMLLSTQSVAKADGFTVTGETNGPVCSRSGAQCAAVTFTLRLTTQLDHNTYGVVYDVTALQGILDGRYSIVGAGGWLLPVIGNPQSPIPYGTISYTLDGQQSIIGFDDFIGSTWMGLVPLGNGTYGSAFVTWNASPVITPEPPTLLLFGTGLLGLVGLASFKNNLGSISTRVS